MKRKHLITALRVAGCHQDRQTWMRVYVENRISLQVANEAWRSGVKAKENGMRCDCCRCQKERVTP